MNIEYPPDVTNIGEFNAWAQRLAETLRIGEFEVQTLDVTNYATINNHYMGQVGSWEITDTSIHNGTITLDNANNRITVDTIVIDGAENEIRIGGTTLKLDADDVAIYLKSTTFGQDGVQLQYNSGNPRAYIGDGSNEYFKFDGTNVSWKGANSALGSDGNLTVTGGTIGGWTINSTSISDDAGVDIDSGNNRIRVYSGSNYVDLTSSGLTGYDSTLGTVFRIYTDGTAPEFSSGVIKECEYQLYTSGVMQTNSAPATSGGLLINNTSLTGYNTSGDIRFQVIYSGTDQGDVTIGDYANNKGLKWDQSAETLDLKGTLETIGASYVASELYLKADGFFRSKESGNYPYLQFENSGLQLKTADTGGTYSTATYSTDKYGYGALVWILNSSLYIPWFECKEPQDGSSNDMASFQLFDRDANPAGGSYAQGQVAMVTGLMKVYRSGAWYELAGIHSTETSLSTGTGTVKMADGTNADNTGWVEISPSKFVPYWDDITPGS